MNKKSNIESIIISKDNYYEDGAKKSISTSIVINRMGEQPDNISFRSVDEMAMFQKVLTEYMSEQEHSN